MTANISTTPIKYLETVRANHSALSNDAEVMRVRRALAELRRTRAASKVN